MVCVVLFRLQLCDETVVLWLWLWDLFAFDRGVSELDGRSIDMSRKGAACKVRLVAQVRLLKRSATDHLLLLSNKLSRQLVGKKLETRSELSLHLECRLERQPGRLSATCAMVRSCVLEDSPERRRRRRSSSCNAILMARSLAIEIHP
jgi:hypothetical protein